MSTIALDCKAIGFEEAGGGDPVFVLEVATALRYEGEALRWPLRCTYAQVDRLHILCYQLEPELRIIEFPKPAGTGFSYGRGMDHEEGAVAADMYDFLQQFFTHHPQYQGRDFFVFGESYAGHYVPAVTHKVWEMNTNLSYD